jgi:hypothetical protein
MSYREIFTEAYNQVKKEESKQKPYVSSSNGVFSVLDADGKEAYKSSSYTLAQDYFKKNYDKLKEVKEEADHEISMARGELEAIADKALQLVSLLKDKSDEGNPLEAWVQSKITKAKDYINSVSDYMMYNPDMKQNEETELEEGISVKAYKNAIDPSKKGLQINKTGGMSGTIFINNKKELNDLMTKLTQATKLYNIKEEEVELEEEEVQLQEKPSRKKHVVFKIGNKLVAKDFKGYNDDEVAKSIDDFLKQNSKSIVVQQSPIQSVKEATYGWTLVSKAKDLAKKFKDNMTKAVDEIEKLEKGLSKNPVVYKELLKYNEEVELDEGKMSKIDALVKQGKSSDEIAKLMNLNIRTVKDILGEEKQEPKKEEDNKEDEIQSLKSQITLLKQKLENEKHKAVKPEPNPKTGEVPLTIGIAAAEFKKDKEKKEVKEENLQELSKAERDKRIQRAKDMIKYYDAQKKAALKGPNKALAKKMLKNETELEEGTKPTDFKVKMKTPSGMKMIKVTVPVKDYKVDMAAIEDAARKKIKGDMMDFDFVGDLKMGESLEEVTQKEIEEALEIKEFTSQMIDRLKKSFSTAPKRISPEQANKLSKHLDRIELNDLRKLVKANIPFVSTVARNKIYKKTGKFEETNLEERRLYVESIAGLQKKADKSGMSYSILKQVYDRGMAAWKSGHRPGASQQQWAFARVNSFITKSSGTWGGADKDLAAKVKGEK